MKVQEIQIDNKKRYVLIDEENNKPVVPVVKYLKYLDNTGKAENTLRAYFNALSRTSVQLTALKRFE